MRSLVQPLFDGPLHIVGDVHGEIDALRSLLGAFTLPDHTAAFWNQVDKVMPDFQERK